MTAQSPATDAAAANAARKKPGRAYFTLSLLAEHEFLEKEFGAGWAVDKRRAHWMAYEDTLALRKAIEPLFDDIADRKRHLFVDDFLLDAPSKPGTKNINELIWLAIPPKIEWTTEGRNYQLDIENYFGLQGSCRMFWFVHSNGSLSYHISFDLEYKHDARSYYALSLLQKAAVDTTEETLSTVELVCIQHEDGRWVAFWDFVRAKFEEHARNLFHSMGLSQTATGPMTASHYWDRLLIARQSMERAEVERIREGKGAAEQPKPILPERRILVVLRDPYFFSLLDAKRRSVLDGFPSMQIEEREGQTTLVSIRDVEDMEPEQLDYYFLSGYFQNIIDFLQQDISEIQDGTDPVYPPAEKAEDHKHFIVYATPKAMYEVVETTRSLDVGQDYIGTCPYLFLVHIMSFHNEALVQMFEREVIKLVTKLEASGLTPTGFQKIKRSGQAETVFNEFLKYRLHTFHEVQKHMHFNVFRYDTERLFFKEIELVRGTDPRRRYWEEVLSRLETTVSDIRDQVRQQSDNQLNRTLAIVTGFSVFQAMFQASDSVRKLIGKSQAAPALIPGQQNALIPDYMDALFLAMLSLLIAGLLVWLLVRRLWASRS